MSRLVLTVITGALVVGLGAGGCRPAPHHYHPHNAHAAPATGAVPPVAGAPAIAWQRIASPADVPSTLPPVGTFRIHLIDVGTGLSILVQGHDFAMVYDAGSNDKDEHPIRVLAYLAAALGPSGDDLCVERGRPAPTSRVAIQNVVLSHPHFDHASAMDLVIHCYDVANFWDSGRVNEAVFYRELIAAVGRSTATTYHTAVSVPADHAMHVKGVTTTIAKWQRFSEDDVVQLGERAKFTILHAEGKQLPDPNQNSLVLAVELGGARLLLVGDAESGARENPTYRPGDVEAFLIEHHAIQIRAEILQVGHHGSKTSSRRAFLDAVHPSLALVSSGPKKYGHVVLPDHEVIDELRAIHATVLRTDEHDDNCPATARIGGGGGPGGCDSFIITVTVAPDVDPPVAPR